MSENLKQLKDLSNKAARSTVAVIDAVTQRGGFKGEELTTIGGLRDQCVQIIQLSEQIQQEDAMADTSTQTENETKPKK
jgi:hypothetical protein|tara:strand:- start:886 stop:1122 length:237 start_codon:yes stop_codon:yes gene_type:complete